MKNVILIKENMLWNKIRILIIITINKLFCFNTSEKSINKIIKKGSLNGNSLLTEQDVLEIRKKYKPRIYTRSMLAIEYKVKESCIKDVVNRNSWKHI